MELVGRRVGRQETFDRMVRMLGSVGSRRLLRVWFGSVLV